MRAPRFLGPATVFAAGVMVGECEGGRPEPVRESWEVLTQMDGLDPEDKLVACENQNDRMAGLVNGVFGKIQEAEQITNEQALCSLSDQELVLDALDFIQNNREEIVQTFESLCHERGITCEDLDVDTLIREKLGKPYHFCPPGYVFKDFQFYTDGSTLIPAGRAFKPADETSVGAYALYPSSVDYGFCNLVRTSAHEEAHVYTGRGHKVDAEGKDEIDSIYMIGDAAMAVCERMNMWN